jgi:hypothetical protein
MAHAKPNTHRITMLTLVTLFSKPNQVLIVLDWSFNGFQIHMDSMDLTKPWDILQECWTSSAALDQPEANRIYPSKNTQDSVEMIFLQTDGIIPTKNLQALKKYVEDI